jgi:hypothetical protein
VITNASSRALARTGLHAGAILLLAGAAVLIVLDLTRAPVILAALFATTVQPWREAWRRAHGTALRPALLWTAASLTLFFAAQLVAIFEPPGGGRTAAARLSYLAVLALLSALVFVLNARMPGDRVWAILTVVLVLVFLIPFLEEPGRLRRAPALGRLHLDAPWSLFYAFIVVVGVTNYVPTRYGAAAAVLALAFLLEYVGLAHPEWPGGRHAFVGSWVSWHVALAVWVAHWCGSRGPGAGSECERLWFWFRDHWGVVWALRVMERFNREAALLDWPARLTWFGLELIAAGPHGPDAPAVPEKAAATLRGLLRRFAHPERLDQAARDGA